MQKHMLSFILNPQTQFEHIEYNYLLYIITIIFIRPQILFAFFYPKLIYIPNVHSLFS